MNKDTYAKLVSKDGIFMLSLEKEGQEPKTVYKDADTNKVIKQLTSILEWDSLEEMLQNSSFGDEDAYEFDRKLQNDEFIIDLEEVKRSKSKINEDASLDISTEVRKELRKNATNDITASALECIYENLASQIFKNLQELVIYRLVLASDELKIHKRLIEIFAQNAGIIDVELTIE